MTTTTKTKVLIAEDDVAMLDLVARWLEAAGYSVAKARDGGGVIEAMGEAVPAAIVMDLTMPRMDGFQTLAKLRELGLPRVPVLVLTGRNSADDVRKAVSLGARDYLAKPVERGQLLGRLERLLGAVAPQAAPPAKDAGGEGSHFID